MRDIKRSRLVVGLVLSLSLVATACGGGDEGADSGADSGSDSGTEEMTEDEGGEETEASGGEDVSGEVAVDGSSTVAPLTDAIAEEYASAQPGVNVTVGVSGTGGGFERFCGTGDTDISNASRPIKDEEAQLCADNGIEFTEVRVGTDALTMVVHPDNPVECLTADQIINIWGPEPVANWNEIEGVDYDSELEVFGPASTSGTFDFFNETILEPAEIEQPRQDYSGTENDNDIVRGVSGTPGGWGYFGFAFLSENEGTIKALEYDAGDGCVAPTVEAAQDDSYKLTRPLFIYVKSQSLAEKPQVADFATFYLENVNSLISDVGYIAAPDETIEEAKTQLADAIESAG